MKRISLDPFGISFRCKCLTKSCLLLLMCAEGVKVAIGQFDFSWLIGRTCLKSFDLTLELRYMFRGSSATSPPSVLTNFQVNYPLASNFTSFGLALAPSKVRIGDSQPNRIQLP